MAGLRKAFAPTRTIDAAYPPKSAPSWAGAVLGYIGPDPSAAHVWTLEQWQPFAHLRQFPAWVCNVSGDPRVQARQAGAAARRLGWRAGRALVGDMETASDRVWWYQFADGLEAEGYVAVCYGSLSTVLGNAAAFVWAALWDGNPVVPAGQTIVACQEQNDVSFDGTQIDVSVIDEILYNLGGTGAREPT